MHLKVSYLSKLKASWKIIVIKSVLRETWVWIAYNRICVLDINAQNDQSCTGIEPALQSSTEELNQSALTTSLRGPWASRNSWKHIKGHSYLLENHEWAVNTRASIVYPQLKFDEIQNNYLTQTLVFSAEIELKKNKLLLEEVKWFIYFKRVIISFTFTC